MINHNYTWFGIGAGFFLVLIALVCKKKATTSDEHTHLEDDTDSGEKASERKTSIQERIRQIALIEKDEFDSFYQPVIECVQKYEQLLTGKTLKQDYFETVYKALRKRRSAIFEYGSSEQDQQKRALWTFALFAAISVRYIANRLSAFDCTLGGSRLNPILLTRDELAKCDIGLKIVSPEYPASLLNIHLIDKVLTLNVIQHLSGAGIYPFLVNSITDFYHERINPFYTIIEQVENHVQNNFSDEDTIFRQSLRVVLELIERNAFSKNQASSLVFEGMSYLLIDRNFLWELFRTYGVFFSQPFAKKEFESQLIKALGLVDVLSKNNIYIVSVESNELDKSQEKKRLMLTNMIALPYKSVSYYRYSERRRIEKQTLKRDVVIDEMCRGLAEHDVVKSVNKIDQRSELASSESSPNQIGVNDLFSDRQ